MNESRNLVFPMDSPTAGIYNIYSSKTVEMRNYVYNQLYNILNNSIIIYK